MAEKWASRENSVCYATRTAPSPCPPRKNDELLGGEENVQLGADSLTDVVLLFLLIRRPQSMDPLQRLGPWLLHLMIICFQRGGLNLHRS